MNPGYTQYCVSLGVFASQTLGGSMINMNLGRDCWGLVYDEVEKNRNGEVRNRVCANRQAVSHKGLR